MEFAFLQFGVQLVFDETVEHGSDLVNVLLQSLGVNDDIIDVDYDKSVEHIPEDIVDKGLKSRWTIGQAERHNPVFIVPRGRRESGFPFVTRSNPDEIVGTPQI